MTRKDKKAAPEKAADAAVDPAEKPKQPGKKAKAAAKPADENTQRADADVSGKIHSIRVASDGSGGATFHFTLKGKGKRGTSIALGPDSAAMAQIVLAAAVSGAKVNVRLDGSGDGPRIAAEIEASF